jgi:hypothetical protein
MQKYDYKTGCWMHKCDAKTVCSLKGCKSVTAELTASEHVLQQNWLPFPTMQNCGTRTGSL